MDSSICAECVCRNCIYRISIDCNNCRKCGKDYILVKQFCDDKPKRQMSIKDK